MKKEFVIDSCVFAKLFLQEEDRDLAISFFEEATKNMHTLYVPDIFIYEILNICAVNKLPEHKVLASIHKYKNYNLKIISPSENMLLAAVKMTRVGHEKSGHPSFYDCLYHALAIDKKCQFITSDLRHIAKSKKFGFIKNLGDL